MLLVLDDEATWHSEIVKYLEYHRRLFVDWYSKRSVTTQVARRLAAGYDQAIPELRTLLDDHALTGYRSSALTRFRLILSIMGLQLLRSSPI